jgi:hypothetical protein
MLIDFSLESDKEYQIERLVEVLCQAVSCCKTSKIELYRYLNHTFSLNYDVKFSTQAGNQRVVAGICIFVNKSEPKSGIDWPQIQFLILSQTETLVSRLRYTNRWILKSLRLEDH